MVRLPHVSCVLCDHCPVSSVSIPDERGAFTASLETGGGGTVPLDLAVPMPAVSELYVRVVPHIGIDTSTWRVEGGEIHFLAGQHTHYPLQL